MPSSKRLASKPRSKSPSSKKPRNPRRSVVAKPDPFTTEQLRIARCVAEGDPDWAIADKRRMPLPRDVDYNRHKRAVVRITKKVTKLVVPKDWKVSCTQGRGTGHNWVHARLTPPTRPTTPAELEAMNKISGRVEPLLMAVGIAFGSYYTDFGPGDHYAPCLQVGLSWY